MEFLLRPNHARIFSKGTCNICSTSIFISFKSFAICTASLFASTTAFSLALAVEIDTHFCNLSAQLIGPELLSSLKQ